MMMMTMIKRIKMIKMIRRIRRTKTRMMMIMTAIVLRQETTSYLYWVQLNQIMLP